MIVVFFLAGVVCPELENPRNGRVSLPMGTAFGDLANYTCDDGLLPVFGDTIRTCEANGQWSGSEPICGKQLQSACTTPTGTCIHRVKSSLLYVTSRTQQYSCHVKA